MALVQWKQINPQLLGNGQLTGSLEITGSFILNGQELDLTGGVVSSNQTLSLNGYELTISNGNTVTLPQGGGSIDTGSLITSATANGNVITFTNGDSSTFDITIDTGSSLEPTDISALNTFTSSYFADSASFDSRISNITSSTADTSGLLTTASYQTDSSSFDSRLSSIESNTTSLQSQIDGIVHTQIPEGTISSSAQITALGFISESVGGTSDFTQLTNVPSGLVSSSNQVLGGTDIVSGSVLRTLDGTGVLSGSKTDISSLNEFTSSYLTDSASFDSRISNIGDHVNISNLNQFTQSAESRLSQLEAQTGSYLTSETDNQTLTIVGDQLTISDGNTITIPTGSGGGTSDFTQLTNVPSGLVSSSTQITDGSGIVSGSVLRTLDGTGVLSGSKTDISHLNEFTSSYLTDSSSFDTRISAINISGDTSYDGNRIVSNEDLGALYNNSFNAGTTGSVQEFLNAVFFPNTAPTFNTPVNQEVTEFANSGSTLTTLSATDSEGQPVTFGTASSYTDGFVTIASDGTVTLAVIPTEVNFNTEDRGDGTLAHPVEVEVTDSFGSTTTQTYYFTVNVNTAPKFRQTSTSGTVITSFSVNRNENASSGLVGRIYFTDDEGDAITITSASDASGHFTLTKYASYVQIDQVTGSLDYENITSYTMSISASDEHYPTQDADAITTLPITINVTDNLQPTINNQTLDSINEDSSAGATVDTITASDNEGDTRTFFDFTLSKLELDNIDVPLNTYGGTNQASDPTENPFQMNSSGVVTRKAGVYLNSDLINEYQYSVKVKDSFNSSSNSATVTIPIADDPAPFIYDNWSGGPYVIESATTGEQIKTNSNGFSGTQARVTSNESVTWSTNSSLIQVSGTGYLSMNSDVSGSYTAGQSFQADITASNSFGTANNTLVTFTITENLPPVITLTDLALNTDTAVSGANIASVTITDQESNTPYSVALSGTDGGSFNLVSQNAANSSLFIQPTSSLPQGTYDVTVTATDTFGKIGSRSISLDVSSAADNGVVYVYTSTFGNDTGLTNNYLGVMGAATVNSDVPPQVTSYTANTLSPFFTLKGGSIGDSSITLAAGEATLQATGSGSDLDNVLSSLGTISTATTGQVILIYPSGSDMSVPTSIEQSFNSAAGGAVPCMNVDGQGFGIESGDLHSIVLDSPHLGYNEWFVFGRKSQNSIASNFTIRLVAANGSLPS